MLTNTLSGSRQASVAEKPTESGGTSSSTTHAMPLGAFFIIIFAGWVLPKDKLRGELEAHGGGFRLFSVCYPLIKYVIPLVILFIFANGLYSWLA